ncbi:ABC transporter permease, partial [Rhizobium sp. 58]
ASIGALFMAGILPGIVMTALLMLTVFIFARRHGWGSDTPFELRRLAGASLEVVIVLCFPAAIYLLIMAGLSVNIAVLIGLAVLVAVDWYFNFHAVMALMTPVLLIGGMTMGWFTPTEAAVAAVIWSLFLGLVRYRTMTFRALAKASFDTIETTASVLFIVTAASIFAWLLTVSQAAQLFSDFMFALTDNWWTFLILVNILLLIIGAFLDTIAAISILVPILMPVAARYGIDPVHLGVIITLNLMIGLLTPPIGMVLFVLSRISKMSVERTTMAILPWMIPLFVALLLITFIPALTLWLPTQLGLIR